MIKIPEDVAQGVKVAAAEKNESMQSFTARSLRAAVEAHRKKYGMRRVEAVQVVGKR